MSRYLFCTRNKDGWRHKDIEVKKGKKLSVSYIDNGVIIPAKADPSGKVMWAIGGVVDSKGKFVEESAFPKDFFGGIYEYGEEEENSDEIVVFLGPLVYHWGHFICDLVSRLWFVLDNPKKYKIAYCGWSFGSPNIDISGNFLEFFNLLGIEKSQLIDIQKPTRFKKVIIPDVSMSKRERIYTKEFKEIFSRVIHNALEKKDHMVVPKKIYFTRENFEDAKKKEYGEQYISEFFQSNGYKILSPENLSLTDQIACFQKAERIAAVSGTITHNMLFASKSLELIVINKLDLVNHYQTLIDSMNNNKVVLIDAYRMILPVLFGKGPFLFEPNKYLKEFAVDYGYVPPTGLSLKNRIKGYWWYFRKYCSIYKDSVSRNLLFNQQEARRALKK